MAERMKMPGPVAGLGLHTGPGDAGGKRTVVISEVLRRFPSLVRGYDLVRARARVPVLDPGFLLALLQFLSASQLRRRLRLR
jgi:hypothetical protein